MIEVAGVDARGFPGLNGGEDLERIGPPVIYVDGGGVGVELFRILDC